MAKEKKQTVKEQLEEAIAGLGDDISVEAALKFSYAIARATTQGIGLGWPEIESMVKSKLPFKSELRERD